MVCCGIGPYFREKVLQKIKEAECITISFDEFLNNDFQTQQMDIIVHYFNEDRVVTQYFDTQFMGHTTASDLFESLMWSLSKLNNRNYSRYPWINQELIGNYYHCCVRTERKRMLTFQNYFNGGSCGLHAVHAAFCTGCKATDWKIEGLLRALWYLFHDSPARRDDYTIVTGSTVFPL